jgi:hypothetical protein
MHFFLKLLITGTIAILATVLSSGGSRAAAIPGACSTLSSAMERAPAGPVFLASFPSAGPGPLHDSAFSYDNAVAIIALKGCGNVAAARRIGDAFLLALDHDRTWHDGRLRNAYAAGPVADGAIKLPGWWDEQRQMWLEDRYQVGSDAGNLAWVALALETLHAVSGDRRYLEGAERIATWLLTLRDDRGSGGFLGGFIGHEPTPQPLTWKSTEHNTDLVPAFFRLWQATRNTAWRDAALHAARFVQSMWIPASARFATGTGDDGTTSNPLLALDAQVWPFLAMKLDKARLAEALSTIEGQLAAGGGFSYSEASKGLWTEGSAQVALLYLSIGSDAKAATVLSALATVRTADGSFFATADHSLPTGFMLATDPTKPRLYFHLPHLGALAWVALAETATNPFSETMHPIFEP